MTTIQQIENTVRQWVETVSGRDCFIQEQMGPVPVDPYATIYLQPIDHQPHDTSTYDDVEGEQTQRGLALVTFSISLWGGDDVMQVANRVRVSTEADSRIYDIYQESGKGAVGNIQDLTSEYEGNRQRRAEFNLSLYATLSETFDVECFDKTDFTTPDGDTETIGLNNPPPSQDTTGCP